jgi:hypothetical protein
MNSNDRYIFGPLLYMSFPLVVGAAFYNETKGQIDEGYLWLTAFIFDILILLLIIKIIKEAHKSARPVLRYFHYLILTLGFITCLFGSKAMFSFVNQLGDNSTLETRITTVSKSGDQSEEDIKVNGTCYYLKRFDDSRTYFGWGDLCEKTHPGIAHKNVLVSFRKGNLSQRWAVKYEVIN